jgi:hypothetical protein
MFCTKKLARLIVALGLVAATTGSHVEAAASPHLPAPGVTPALHSAMPEDRSSPNAAAEYFGQQRVVLRAGDYDGDGDSDIAVWRPRTGVWYLRGIARVQFGRPGDIPVQADYDGDGRTDLAVWRPTTGVWYIRRWNGTINSYQWGLPGDVPYPINNRCGSGFGRAALVIWRPSTGVWWQRFGARTCTTKWGEPGDIPIIGSWANDYCVFVGDRYDIAVWRPSTGVWLLSPDTSDRWKWGVQGDIPVSGFESMGCHASPVLAVWRPANGTWYIYTGPGLFGGAHPSAARWGQIGDVPLSGNYTGDAASNDITDLAVWRPSTGVWYIRDAPTRVRWGEIGDIPV